MPKKQPARASRPSKPPRSTKLADYLRECERAFIESHLAKHRGNIAATAEDLGIGRRTLEGKMLDLGLRERAGELRAAAGIRGPR